MERAVALLRAIIDLGGEGTPKPLPREFRPMLASPWSEPPGGPNWIREVKWDGYRCPFQNQTA
jgi:ATP-dependent DNA ligase